MVDDECGYAISLEGALSWTWLKMQEVNYRLWGCPVLDNSQPLKISSH